MKQANEVSEVPMGTLFGLVMETLRAINERADRNDIGTQTVITFLAVAQARGALPQTQLMKVTGMTQAGVSRNVGRLSVGSRGIEGLHLVEAFEDPEDRRYKLVRLTQEGAKLVDYIASRTGKYLTSMLKNLGDKHG